MDRSPIGGPWAGGALGDARVLVPRGAGIQARVRRMAEAREGLTCALRAGVIAIALAGSGAGCIDKAPDPLWPEPPPPTLAEPLGQAPARAIDDGSRSVGAMPPSASDASQANAAATDDDEVED